MSNSSPADTKMEGVNMEHNQTPPPIPSDEPKYGGFTRFEIELEVRYPTIQFQPRVFLC